MAADEPTVADLVQLGSIAYATGQAAEAQTYWVRAFERALVDGQSQTTDQLGPMLAGLYEQQGRFSDAMKVMQQTIVLQLRPLWRELIKLTQVEREKLIRRHRTQVDEALSRLLPYASREGAARTALDLLLWRRGLGVEPYRAASRAARREPAIAAKVEAVRILRATTAAGLLTYQSEPPEKYRTALHLEGLRKSPEINQLEAEIFSQLTDEDCAAALKPPDCDAVAAHLPAESALIMYYRCRVTHEQNQKAPRYLAVVLRPGDAPRTTLFDLGLAREIEECLKHFQAALLGVTSDNTLPRRAMRSFAPPAEGRSTLSAEAWRSAGQDLRRLIVDPLADALNGVTRLFIVPDGLLAQLSFATLPTDDGFLVDQHLISYLTSGRELCEEAAAGATGPVVIAAPDYNLHSGDAPGLPPDADIWFADLPGSDVEGKLVAEQLKVRSISGPLATKQRFIECESPVVLHISTHGTLLPVVPIVAEIDPRAPFDLEVETVGTVVFPTNLGRLARVEVEDQALRSLLASAGINTWLAGGELPYGAGNGWLNAEDIALINLSGTRLVVLSACETGLGVIEIGESVLSVRNAFSVAGAGTVVSTLWQVQDAFVTPELMVAFYDGLADGTTPAALSLCRAQRAARKAYPDRPDWWGPFICHGGPGILPAGLIQPSANNSQP